MSFEESLTRSLYCCICTLASLNFKGHVKFLIIKDHDRFSRNLSEALTKIEHLEKKFGVKVVVIDEPINIDTSDPSIFLSRAFKYLMANHELLNIRKRTAQGIRNAIASGRVVNSAPWGYKNIRDVQGKPTLQIDGTRAPIIQLPFALTEASGQVPAAIKRKK